MTTFFIAGIIQGSVRSDTMHPQDYRERIRKILASHVPDAEVYCPIEHHPDSLKYDDAHGREVFFDHLERAGAADVVVAFLPEASMGTAIEMWEAHRNGRIVLTVTDMTVNWSVKFLSTRIFPDLSAFERFVTDGGLVRLIRERTEQKA